MRWRKEQTTMLNIAGDRPGDDDDDDDADDKKGGSGKGGAKRRGKGQERDSDNDDDDDYDTSKPGKRAHKQKQWRQASQRSRYGGGDNESKDTTSYDPSMAVQLVTFLALLYAKEF